MFDETLGRECPASFALHWHDAASKCRELLRKEKPGEEKECTFAADLQKVTTFAT